MKKSEAFVNARTIIRDTFKTNPDFKRTYIDNVAMYLYNCAHDTDMTEKPTRDHIAEGIIDLIFGNWFFTE